MIINFNPLPEIKVVPLTATNQEPVFPHHRRGRPATVTTTMADIRWMKMEEFLNSSALAPNSRKVYERELRRFLIWTELLWSEIKPRHFSQYKAYLMKEVRTDKEVVLQKLIEDRKFPEKGIGYAATPKILAINLTRF